MESPSLKVKKWRCVESGQI